MAVLPIVSYRENRLAKLRQLKELGIDPYPSSCARTHVIQQVIVAQEQLQGTSVTIAGRLMSWRPHGKSTFGQVQDHSARIQIWLNTTYLQSGRSTGDGLGYTDLRLIDIGDFLEISGEITKTRRGELSILARTIRILTKTLRPLPDKWHKLKDRETALRKRFLSLTMEPERKAPFELISKLLLSARNFLYEEGFLEFLTPVLQQQYGGGTAKPFTTFANAINRQMFLAISHELYLKRLIAAGFDRVFTIGRYFRNEGIDRYHQPEFSMIETMTAYEDYIYNMDLVERLFRHLAEDVFGKTTFRYAGHELDFSAPWRRVLMADAINEVTGIKFKELISLEDARRAVESLGICGESSPSIGHCMVQVFEKFVEHTLIQPTLVYGHPVDISPLAKACRDDPRFAERFEIFIAGTECGDNWSEENDPQRLLSHWNSLARSAPDDENHPIDYEFLEVLEYGIPPTTGIGPGIERLAMIFTEQENIDDVVFFPLMRSQISRENQAIFNIEEISTHANSSTEVYVTIDEFGSIPFLDLVNSEQVSICCKPFLEILPARSDRREFRARGYVRVQGLLPGKIIIVFGYSSRSTQPMVFATEARAFRDIIFHGLVLDITRVHNSALVEVEAVQPDQTFSDLLTD